VNKHTAFFYLAVLCDGPWLETVFEREKTEGGCFRKFDSGPYCVFFFLVVSL